MCTVYFPCVCVCVCEQTLNRTHSPLRAIRNDQLEYTLFTAYCPDRHIYIHISNKNANHQHVHRSVCLIYEYDFCPISSRKYFIIIYLFIYFRCCYGFFFFILCPLPLNVVLMDGHLWCRQVKILCIIVRYIEDICVPKTIPFFLHVCVCMLVSLQQIAADQTLPHCIQYEYQAKIYLGRISIEKYGCILHYI